MQPCDLTLGVLIGLCIAASLRAGTTVVGQLTAVLPWLTLAIATTDWLALGIAAAHSVGAYLLFVRVQGALVRDAFALAEGAATRGFTVVRWKNRVPMQALHPARPVPR